MCTTLSGGWCGSGTASQPLSRTFPPAPLVASTVLFHLWPFPSWRLANVVDQLTQRVEAECHRVCLRHLILQPWCVSPHACFCHCPDRRWHLGHGGWGGWGRTLAQAWRGGHCYRSTTLQDGKLPGSAVFGEGKSKAFARVVRYIEVREGGLRLMHELRQLRRSMAQ